VGGKSLRRAWSAEEIEKALEKMLKKRKEKEKKLGSLAGMFG
jgi:hypothetical protein